MVFVDFTKKNAFFLIFIEKRPFFTVHFTDMPEM